MIIVRRAEYNVNDMSDAAFLARRMHAESPAHMFMNFNPAKVAELVTNAIKSEDWLPLLAHKDGKPVGMALVVVAETFYGTDKECTDLVFYVDPTERGSRCAYKMLHYIELWASDKDAERIQMGIHNGIDHEGAANFFERLGYKRQGLLMEKSVH